MSYGYVIQQALNSLQVSGFYALLAASFVLMHAITRRINFAFGALSVWAGYTFINLTLLLLVEMPGSVLLPLVVAAAISAAHTTLAGYLTERLVVRPLLRESSLAMLVTTLGLAISLEESIRIANGTRERWLPPLVSTTITLTEEAGFSVMTTSVHIVGLVISVTLVAALAFMIARHPFGRSWRACSQDLRMAELCGVDVSRTLAITFLIATAYAGAAGVLISLVYGVATFQGGFVIGLKTLFVAVVGGLNSVSGAFVGALALGIFETFWSSTVGFETRDAAAFIMLSLLLILFPEGLLAGRSASKVV